jgi:hypothetical protein
MIDSNNPRMELPRAEMQRMKYNCTKDKFMTKDWLKEYAPRTPSDLVLQKPKLDQLNAWLQRTSTRVGMVRSCTVLLLYHFLKLVWLIKGLWVLYKDWNGKVLYCTSIVPFRKMGVGDKGSLGFVQELEW